MSNNEPKTAKGAPGLKLLLTAAAVAATLAGWAGLAGRPAPVTVMQSSR
jgi:hypothetical protein